MRFKVFKVDRLGERTLLDESLAVSRAKAISNVRYNHWGETSVDDLAKLGIRLEAEPILGGKVAFKPLPFPRLLPPIAEIRRPVNPQFVFGEFLRRNPVY
ncbi:MAG: hypothetical protein V1704_02555 [Candidatus Vogelbacteria bacterium]